MTASTFPRAAAVVLVILGAASVVQAGGATLFDNGARDTGLAIAGRWAEADDACAVLSNPAGMTRLDGRQMSLGFQPLLGSAEFDGGPATSNTGGDGGDASVPAPVVAFCYKRDLGESGKWDFGFGTGGVAGGAFEFDDDWAGRYYLTELEFNALFAGGALSYRINDRVSFGFSAGAVLGVFNQKAQINNVLDAIPDGELEIDDDAVGFGATVGFLYEPTEKTRFGVVYVSEVDLDFEDALETEGVGPGLQAVLNLVGIAGSDLDIGLTLPQKVLGSWYHEVTDRVALMGNLGWENYDEFGFVDVSIKNTSTIDITADLEFDDTYHGAIGARIRMGESSAFTAGIGYDSSPVASEDRSPVLPLDQQTRIAFGYQRERESGNRWTATLALLDLGNAKLDVGTAMSLRGRLQGEFDPNRIAVLGFVWEWR
jgi:long-chain fatty acid transport protein